MSIFSKERFSRLKVNKVNKDNERFKYFGVVLSADEGIEGEGVKMHSLKGGEYGGLQKKQCMKMDSRVARG